MNDFNCSKWNILANPYSEPITKSGLIFEFQFCQHALSGLRETLKYKLAQIFKNPHMSFSLYESAVLLQWFM